MPISQEGNGARRLERSAVGLDVVGEFIMYLPLVAAFTVATALSNSLLLPASIVVGVAANADIGITNA